MDVVVADGYGVVVLMMVATWLSIGWNEGSHGGGSSDVGRGRGDDVGVMEQAKRPYRAVSQPTKCTILVSVAGGEEVMVVEVMTWCRGCGGGWWVWRGGVDDDDDGGDVAVDGVEVVEVVWMRSDGGMAGGRWPENGRSGAGFSERRGVEGDKEGEELEEEEGDDLEYFDTFPFREELEYREWVLKNSRPF
nr:hypothetical protein [Tanacetum cinerariifolium]